VRDEVHSAQGSFESNWSEVTAGLDGSGGHGRAEAPPVYQPVRKNWRIKRSATPNWYKKRAGVRTHVQSGAARVRRFRPRAG
jgi:sec-independent protein translocase protein TatB